MLLHITGGQKGLCKSIPEAVTKKKKKYSQNFNSLTSKNTLQEMKVWQIKTSSQSHKILTEKQQTFQELTD